ncbi:hypothetical protein AVEN_222382-1 [Araneus ventricosus]|uniref:Secreted protein n=1 Tax=Araneus ventricosus TaxID=182803 RepID=A0A4Y2EGB7_ARAVE|nr:hypothetical protein AVEN_222382-1 [Araneus ventricosus]
MSLLKKIFLARVTNSVLLILTVGNCRQKRYIAACLSIRVTEGQDRRYNNTGTVTMWPSPTPVPILPVGGKSNHWKCGHDQHALLPLLYPPGKRELATSYTHI